jgi:hypothetical protein
VCASPIHRLVAAEVGQNNRIVSAIADTRKITTVSVNQPMVEAPADSCYTDVIDSRKRMLSGWVDNMTLKRSCRDVLAKQ